MEEGVEENYRWENRFEFPTMLLLFFIYLPLCDYLYIVELMCLKLMCLKMSDF